MRNTGYIPSLTLQVLCRSRILNTVPSYFTRLRSDTSLILHETVSGPWRRNFSFINIQPQLFEHNAESSNGNGPCDIFVLPRQGKSASQHRTRAAAPACCTLSDGYGRPVRSNAAGRDCKTFGIQTLWTADGHHARKTAGADLL